jgi:HSP20 family protein
MLMRFDPFADLDRLTRDMFTAGRRPTMPVDAYRQGDRFYLHFDLPGIDPDSVDITVEKNALTVTVERSWKPAEDATVVINERPQGTFSRQFFLGEGLDADHIEAGYDHGVLTVTIPVAEQAKPRKISVGAADKALAG